MPYQRNPLRPSEKAPASALREEELAQLGAEVAPNGPLVGPLDPEGLGEAGVLGKVDGICWLAKKGLGHRAEQGRAAAEDPYASQYSSVAQPP